jgi:hypothetical protein
MAAGNGECINFFDWCKNTFFRVSIDTLKASSFPKVFRTARLCAMDMCESFLTDFASLSSNRSRHQSSK